MSWTKISAPKALANQVTASHIIHGPSIPPQQRLLTYSPAEWEEFVHEWAHYSLKQLYVSVERFSGAGDAGIDVAGFTDTQRLNGVWDSYQCKHYDRPLTPSDAWVEFGKVIWHSFNGEYAVPRHHYFVAPLGVGTKLSKLLGNATKLREELISNWDKHVKSQITTTQAITLESRLRAYVDAFDFSIFKTKTAIQLINDIRKTPVYAERFGGGLPPRPFAPKPPDVVELGESPYVTQLMAAYGEHIGTVVSDPADLLQPKLMEHFQRQREAFYEAESLRVFARDTVPPGTFESLQSDIYEGVIDTHDAAHPDGYQKVCSVTKAAREMQITANALINCTNPKDRDGICHQLVNQERLKWTR